jgi:hypothetical protein
MKVKVNTKNFITRCIDCPYFQDTMDGCTCFNPKYPRIDAYDDLLIFNDILDDFPKDCPLIKTK